MGSTSTKNEYINILEELAFTAFMEAAPYLQNPEWVKKTYVEGLKKAGKMEQLKNFLIEQVEKEEDKFKQVDLKIYLTYLGKVWRKHFGSKP